MSLARLHLLGPALGGLLMAIGAVQPMAMAATSPKSEPKPGSSAMPAEDLQLDPSSITGSRELPTVLNILPWKQPVASDLRGQPADSLLNDVLAPIDRVEFRRELRYSHDGVATP